MEFWSQLKEERPDLAKLNDIGAKINQELALIEDYWKEVQKLNPNSPKALKMYSKFLSEILNDKEGGSELMQRYKEAISGKMGGGYETQENITELNILNQNGIPCIILSAQEDKMGQVLNCNAASARLFGYTLNEVKSFHVDKLMPDIYIKTHARVLEQALSKGPETISQKER